MRMPASMADVKTLRHVLLKSPRTLLNTPSQAAKWTVGSEKYVHFGLDEYLGQSLDENVNKVPHSISIQSHFGGLIPVSRLVTATMADFRPRD